MLGQHKITDISILHQYHSKPHITDWYCTPEEGREAAQTQLGYILEQKNDRIAASISMSERDGARVGSGMIPADSLIQVQTWKILDLGHESHF